jgi:two-component system phosphate regulon sensor histidine kinase PhoR
VKKLHIQIIILFAVLITIGITIIQAYWFNMAFNIRQKQVESGINTALQQVAWKMWAYNDHPIPDENPVQPISQNYFVVQFNDEINVPLLETLLVNEFKKRNIKTDLEYAVYNCESEQLIYGDYLNLDDRPQATKKIGKWPSYGDSDYYFGVHFPNMSGYVFSNMQLWLYSSIIMLLLFLFFAFVLIVLFRQKRFTEIQKDFINTISHEFKTPLTTIVLSADVLLKPGIEENTSKLTNYAGIIKEESDRLKQLTTRALDLNSIDQSHFKLQTEYIQPIEIIRAVVRQNKQEIETCSANVDIVSETTIKPIKADPLHLSGVIGNLLINALKHNQKQPRVIFSLREQKKWMEISCTDNGLGIPKKERKKIFEKYYRIEQHRKLLKEGLGLGLHYVRRIVTLHGGSIELSNNPYGGTTFSIKLPYHE